MPLKVIIYLMTASVSLLSAAEDKGEQVSVNCADTPVSQFAYVGDSVAINCTYPTGNQSVKHFCKEDKQLQCKGGISARSSNYTETEKFSMKDHKYRGVYTVLIKMLTEDDAGRYQCALKTNKPVCLTKIHLHVLRRNQIIPTNLTCSTGKTANLQCPYPHDFENYTKYLCKGENPSNCVELIHTTEEDRDVAVGRISIRDNKRKKYFYVAIKNLDTTDSGTYWCGFNSSRGKWHHGNFTKIHPCVDRRHGRTNKSSISTDLTATPPSMNLDVAHSNSGVISGVSACLVIIMTVVIVLILCRHRLTRTQGGSPERSTNDGQNTRENHEGHVYEEVQECIQLADQLHYASVSFQSHSATGSTDRAALSGTAENGSSACDYSSVKRSGTPPPLYSTLKANNEEL